jgi:hypothetical protein
VALGNCTGYREDDKIRFVSGLKGLLQELRQKKIKDFGEIARRICEFRQMIRGDRSKVLMLDA